MQRNTQMELTEEPALVRSSGYSTAVSSRENSCSLGHVYWLGGSPCAGKSSIGALLAHEFGLQVFSVDEAFSQKHRHHLDLRKQPTLHKWVTSPWADLWVQPADVLLAEAKAAYREHFELILEDVSQIPDASQILVEGTALLPDRVSSLQVTHHRAIWLVPTEEFQRTHYPSRGNWVHDILEQCHDPDQALQKWMDRDVAFAKWVVDRTQALGYRVLEIDGTRGIEEYATLVARHFQLR
jgi:2-phosphoglycerate kinase